MLTNREKEMEKADKDGYQAFLYKSSNPYTNLDKSKAAAWDAGYKRARAERQF